MSQEFLVFSMHLARELGGDSANCIQGPQAELFPVQTKKMVNHYNKGKATAAQFHPVQKTAMIS